MSDLKRGNFSSDVFGEDLAEILDGLLRVQECDNAGYAGAPVPLLSTFTKPTGISWYEADMLTRHYHMVGISWHLAMQRDAEFAALFAEKRSADGAVVERPARSMLDARTMLHERWAAQNLLLDNE